MFKKMWIPFIAALVLFNQGLWSKDWPQWRGPNRDGIVRNFDIPATWPDSLRLVWRVPVGAGLSSPVVANGKIYLLTRDAETEVASAYNLADGGRLWQKTYAAQFIPNAQAVIPRFFPESRGKGPFATPLVQGERLYTLGVDRTLCSFDANNGDLKWQHHYLQQAVPAKLTYECPPCGCNTDGKEFDQPGQCPDCRMTYGAKGVETTATRGGPNYYGAASSPLIVDDVVIVQVGNAQKGSLIALDRLSGKQRWVWEGPAISSSSPVLANLNGVAQLVSLTRTGVTGVSLADGDLLWSFPLESNAQIVTPVVFEDLVIFSAYRSPTTAVRITRDRNNWSAEQAWQNSGITLYTSTPILDGDKLYGLSYTKRGQFFSMNARTGQTLWTSEGRQAQGAAILDAGSVLLALTDNSQLRMIDKNPDGYSLLKQYSVAQSPTWAHPVISRTFLSKMNQT